MPAGPCGMPPSNASKVAHMPAAAASPAITPYFRMLRHMGFLRFARTAWQERNVGSKQPLSIISRTHENRIFGRDDIDAVIAGQECVMGERDIVPDPGSLASELGHQRRILHGPERMGKLQLVFIDNATQPVTLVRVRVEQPSPEPDDDDSKMVLLRPKPDPEALPIIVDRLAIDACALEPRQWIPALVCTVPHGFFTRIQPHPEAMSA